MPSRITRDVLVEFSQFVLFDVFGDASLAEIDIPRDSAWVAASGYGGARFHAMDQSIFAAIAVEVHQHAPADPMPEVVHGCEGEFATPTGRLLLASLTGSPSDTAIALPSPGRYRFRARRWAVDQRDPDRSYDTFESWIIQIWHATG
ncbi:hypothetical protein GCM10010174_66800 [Kutzneria viridogrisea]|uniref:Uncharacterized protein n=2 Tax=Kutzneria TaxID=43356 RepID=W5WKX9_9PSEU|nr:hypothetical protein [Kutzneria albida]AHH98829.1 hypothetical protein KALB_5467 [Kutzneria albida DSM 43870]MBA8923650.1 hypothetical protein [Kutzneria viridogrisea]